jgi:protein-tyrosine phosphatase
LVKILFVCTGNICRSPIAEGILRDKLNKLKVPALVDSCGFESFHEGDHPDPRACSVAMKYGIDISSHRARLFTTRDFNEFDHIYVMDSSHFNKVMSLARNESDEKKVDYILNVMNPGGNKGVQDPWYHDMEAFEKVYRQLDLACERLSAYLHNNPNPK